MTMSKTESQENKRENAPVLSVCDVMRDNTNQVIVKVESLFPSFIESFANIQQEYLHIAKDFFGTCYIAEKELLDKMGVDHKTIEDFDKYLKVLTKYTILDIDMANNFQKTFVTNIISGMKTYDNYVKLMLSEYAKMLEYTSALLPKKS
jgi:hypothetical protein